MLPTPVMPIFQDDLEQVRLAARNTDYAQSTSQRPSPALRRLSEESLPTELCEGPIPDSPLPTSPETKNVTPPLDRAELIERLKKRESPNWLPKHQVG